MEISNVTARQFQTTTREETKIKKELTNKKAASENLYDLDVEVQTQSLRPQNGMATEDCAGTTGTYGNSCGGSCNTCGCGGTYECK